MSVVIKCSECGEKIADYTGPIGLQIAIESKFYVRTDGTSPSYGSSTAHACPNCSIIINELECALSDISLALNPPITAQLPEADDESSSDCCT